MLNKTMLSVTLLLGSGLVLPLSSSAQVAGEGVETLPPPPGPYISSRPKLFDDASESQESGLNLPFMDDMPGMPMRYMPSPNQMPAPPFGWRGPMMWR